MPYASAIRIVRCSFSGISGYFSDGGLKMYCPPRAPTTVSRLFPFLGFSLTIDNDNLGCTPGTAILRSTTFIANSAIWLIEYGKAGDVGDPKNALQHFS